MIKISVPGKVHLIGEHTVVYGKPALISAISLRVYLTIGKKMADYTFKTELPKGTGLGSSAAVSAAVIAAMLTYFKVNWDKDLVNKLTFEAEKIFHGKPSGGDNTTVIFGGIINFQNGVSSPIKSKLQKLVLINSGEPAETTKEMLGVAKPNINSILDSQEKLTQQMELALKQGDDLREIIKKAEKNLEKIGVVGKIAKKIVRDIENLGGAAKISGAGGLRKGSGMLLCYHKNPKKILDYAKKNDLPSFNIKLGAEGLKLRS